MFPTVHGGSFVNQKDMGPVRVAVRLSFKVLNFSKCV